jgi:hypothetical protein
MNYDPPRQTTPTSTGDPLEIELVFNVRRCGTCKFFWPRDPAKQPYGPYPSYDLPSNTPPLAEPAEDQFSFAWLKGKTRPPSFPDAEVMDGCRKAPIMTIGINPNLTAFLPGQNGASWCYPSFSSDGGEDSWTKYAYYYRYRSVYQERFDLEFARRFLLSEGRIVASKAGQVTAALRPSSAPGYKIKVRYAGDSRDTTINLPGKLGSPPYVLLFDTAPPHNRFKKGDVIAARLDVPGGQRAQIYAQQIGYYERMVPVLRRFEAFLRRKGHAAKLRVGEDVGQLDMVACASPHWGPPWLGGSTDSVRSIIANCVEDNAWAIKQLIQTRPAVLFLVGESSFNMFSHAFGQLIKSDPPLPARPQDGAFTLLRATTDPAHPCLFEFAGTFDGHRYAISTRLVVTPHFSYGANFRPQFRMSASAWRSFRKKFAACAKFLQSDPRLAPAPKGGTFVGFEIRKNVKQVLASIRKRSPAASAQLSSGFYDANVMMESVLEDLYAKQKLSFVSAGDKDGGYLSRNDGPCSFCDNRHWTFPKGCPYGKPKEPLLPAGLLNKAAAQIIRSGALPMAEAATQRIYDDGFEARRGPPTASDFL